MGGLVREKKDLDHQLLHGGFRGGGGQQLQAGTRPYTTLSVATTGLKIEHLYTYVNLLQCSYED